MKFTCNQEDLRRALETVQPAASGANHQPLTRSALVEASDQTLRLTATDLSKTITTSIVAAVEESGSLAVPARMLTDFVKSLPSDRLSVESENGKLSVRCARFAANIAGAESDEFPNFPILSEDGTEIAFFGDESKPVRCVSLRIGADEMADAIERTIGSAATEDSRPTLCGLRIEIQRARFSVATADGFRLSVYES